MEIVTMINEDKIILLIIKAFVKIFAIIEIIMRASKESAGLDLYSNIDIDIEVGLIKKVNTRICISLP